MTSMFCYLPFKYDTKELANQLAEQFANQIVIMFLKSENKIKEDNAKLVSTN